MNEPAHQFLGTEFLASGIPFATVDDLDLSIPLARRQIGYSGAQRGARLIRVEGFARDHTIREKYNVVSGNANVQVSAGYKQNVIGFGWTNAVYLKMREIVAAEGRSWARDALRLRLPMLISRSQDGAPGEVPPLALECAAATSSSA